MWGSAAQKKRSAPWLWAKTTETEKGQQKSEDKGRFDRLSLEGQTRSLQAD